MVKRLLSVEEARAVEDAIFAVEKRSATEMVVAIVSKSADYWSYRVLIACGWAMAAALGLHYASPLLPALWVVLVQVPVGALVFLALKWPPLQRWMVPADRAEAAVRQRAFALFAERGLHRTQMSTGLLILVSELEHRVVILGDSGIHDQVGDAGWTEHVTHLVTHIREGRAAAGLLEVIARLETKLANIVPARSDNIDELPNAVLMLD